MKNKQKGSMILSMIAIVLILTIGGGAYVYLESKKVDKIEIDNEETMVPSTSTDAKLNIDTETASINTQTEVKQDVSSNTDSDIQEVSNLMQKYKIAFESGDEKAIKSFYSKATLEIFEEPGVTFSVPAGLKITIGSITRSGKNIRVEIVKEKTNGSKEDDFYVFIPENGQWKIDMKASFESDVSQNNISQGDPNGYVDLVVTGIKVYPSHPIVNDEDVEIAVTIKNIGTKASEKGAPAVATILENVNYTPTQGGSLDRLGAGESVTWKFDMYGQNKIFKRSDVAGKKTVKVELNGYKDVVEKNYTNNTFTYSFEVFKE